jgi:hypothetical protein
MRMGEFLPTDAGLEMLIANEHLDGLTLELRDELGRAIPTARISTQDCNRLARLGADDMDPRDPDDGHDEETLTEAELDAALAGEWMAEREPADLWNDYAEDVPWDESKPFYQIFVHLHDDAAIPACSDFLIEDSP